jgi:hypothetical protein
MTPIETKGFDQLNRNLYRHRITLTTLTTILQQMEQEAKCCSTHRAGDRGHNIECPVYRGLLSIQMCRDCDKT